MISVSTLPSQPPSDVLVSDLCDAGSLIGAGDTSNAWDRSDGSELSDASLVHTTTNPDFLGTMTNSGQSATHIAQLIIEYVYNLGYHDIL